MKAAESILERSIWCI